MKENFQESKSAVNIETLTITNGIHKDRIRKFIIKIFTFEINVFPIGIFRDALSIGSIIVCCNEVHIAASSDS